MKPLIHICNAAPRTQPAQVTGPHAPVQVSEGANKKTLTPEHVVTAVQQLGFDDFVAEVEAYWQQFKEDAQVTS